MSTRSGAAPAYLRSIEGPLVCSHGSASAAGGAAFGRDHRLEHCGSSRLSGYGASRRRGRAHRRSAPRRSWSGEHARGERRDRKSTRLNSSHQIISYAVFCLKKKTNSSHTTSSKTKKKTTKKLI